MNEIPVSNKAQCEKCFAEYFLLPWLHTIKIWQVTFSNVTTEIKCCYCKELGMAIAFVKKGMNAITFSTVA